MKSTHLLHTGPIGQYSSSETVYFPVGVPLKVIKMSCDFFKNLQIILMTHLGTPPVNNRYGQKTVNF